MSCNWCHESMPPNRKDGFCSDICQIAGLKAESERLRAALEFYSRRLNYDTAPTPLVIRDNGDIARRALEARKE